MEASSLNLDEQQRRVVDHGRGPLCVLGGPGTGKTTVLRERFVRLGLAGGCSPDRILFLVPNRAHKIELQDLLSRRLLFEEGLAAVVDVPVYTWHGFANHLVTRHYRRLAYPEPPVLLTGPEQWGDIRDALAGESPVNWPHYKSLLGSPGFVDEIVDFCIRAQQRLLEKNDLRPLTEARPEYEEIVRFYLKHSEHMRSSSRVDYPTLLKDATELIANHDDVRASLHERFEHILVDDAQELPLVQQRLLHFLAGSPDVSNSRRSLVVAADPDSAIETFRGADPDWLEGFAGTFGGDTVTLATSYRLGPDAGAKTMQFIELSGPQEHRTTSFAGETTIAARRFRNLSAEVEAVARELRGAHLKDEVAYEDMAVLVASPASMLPALERALQAVEVPYSISIPDRPLESEPAVRAFRSLARFAFRADPEALTEALRSPLGALEDREVRSLERAARFRGTSLIDFVVDLPEEIEAATTDKVRHVLALAGTLRGRAGARADEAFWAVWSSARYYRELEERARGEEAEASLRDLDALVAFARALGRFVERRRGRATLPEYLEAVGRADFGADPWLPPSLRSGGVRLLSFHAAKGRQWAIVAVCGCVEGSIPKGRRARGLFDPYFMDEASPVERARRNESEDRRVFFVAATRAARRCIVTASPGPSRRGMPSRFLSELVGEMPEVETLGDRPALTFSESAARHRRTLADPGAPPPQRLVALQSLARIRELDPACAAAQPSEWWWRWDWTQGAVPIRAQGRRDDEDLPEDKLRTSYSRISQYDNCGLAYLCSIVLGLDPDRSHNMAFGTWIHQIFEDCEKEPSPEQAALGRRRLTNMTMVLDRFEELFDDTVFPNKAVARQFRRDGATMLDRYCRHLRPGKALLAEHTFKVDFQGHRITGRIDRVDRRGNGIVVSDYKTSRRAAQYDETRASLQLAIYYLAATTDEELARHGPPISMQLVYPGAPLAHNNVATRCQKPEEARVALERLPQLMEGVLHEDFRPSPEADCTWCKFKPLCPLWPEGKELPA